MGKAMLETRRRYRIMGLKPSHGSFASQNKPHDWTSCREQFFLDFKVSDEGFYFSHEKGETEQVASFIRQVEKVLDLEEYSSFAPTTCPHVMWVEPSDFWVDQLLKLSLFTILLRCGRNYDWGEDNFEEALFSYYLSETTKDAVLRFLFGHTEVMSDVDIDFNSDLRYKIGWHKTFANKSQSYVKSKLVRPYDGSPTPCLVGVNSLWI